jgi:hypothetical protein
MALYKTAPALVSYALLGTLRRYKAYAAVCSSGAAEKGRQVDDNLRAVPDSMSKVAELVSKVV